MATTISAAVWALRKALAPVTDDLLKNWAASDSLGTNISALKTELLRAQGILYTAHDRVIANPALKELLHMLRQLADKAEDVLDELDYFRIQDQLDSTYHSADKHAGGCICGLAFNARHTARAVANKLKFSSAGNLHTPKLKFDRVEMSKRMADIVQQLDPICAKVKEILDLELRKVQPTQGIRPKTTPAIIEPKIFGRNVEKKNIVDGITHGKYYADGLTVLQIVGPGDERDVNDRMAFEEFKRDLSTLEEKLKIENLQTVMLFGKHHGCFAKTFVDIFAEAKSLRVILLSEPLYGYIVEDVFCSFPRLVHLRYLRIIPFAMVTLTSNMSRFYHLRVLDVQERNVPIDFPRDVSKLAKLNHYIVQERGFERRTSDVGKLELLQDLRSFMVKKENIGFEMRQISRLAEFGVSLRIHSIENAERQEEVNEAKLIHKTHIQKLMLEWGIDRPNKDPAKEDHALESLQPHCNLLELHIGGHGGATCPSWLGSESVQEAYVTWFPRLQKLEIMDCPKLLALPPVPWTSAPCSVKITRIFTDDHTGFLAAPICSLLSSSLTKLYLWADENDEVARFSKEQEDALQLLSSLKELAFGSFRKLQCLPAGLHRISSLKTLRIGYCQAFRSLPKDSLPSSLQDLQIWHCRALKSLPEDGLPSSLRKLSILPGNSEELMWQCRKLKGTIPIIIE
ncbi:hypothetical protein ACQ4PT_052252 [Festuca glaucescens]